MSWLAGVTTSPGPMNNGVNYGTILRCVLRLGYDKSPNFVNGAATNLQPSKLGERPKPLALRRTHCAIGTHSCQIHEYTHAGKYARGTRYAYAAQRHVMLPIAYARSRDLLRD